MNEETNEIGQRKIFVNDTSDIDGAVFNNDKIESCKGVTKFKSYLALLKQRKNTIIIEQCGICLIWYGVEDVNFYQNNQGVIYRACKDCADKFNNKKA